ncbi:hypothetical protein [Gimesia algae]|uniref:Uncharacterized protein n=1 Tax=Gimesia algae TaxID=2527971 RepID=A0A517VN76_9PLAN|nr:hypothetical protein [Gimesia algae]QDT94491.1 hypothetical protein Pan161_61870 [Gimesia algae]
MPAENSLILVVTFWSAAFMPTMILSASESEAKLPVKHSLSEREFRAQYAHAVKKFKAAYQNIECRAECQSLFDDPNEPSRQKRYVYSEHVRAKGNSIVAEQDYAAETPLGGIYSNEIVCATPDYAFELDKTRPDNPYLLTSVTHISTAHLRTRLRIIMGHYKDWYLYAAGSLDGCLFEEIIEKPSFSVTKLERVPSQMERGEQLVALDFKVTEDPWAISSGHIVFAPDRNWAVLEFQYRCDYSATDYSTYAGRNFFSSNQKHEIPVPEKCEHKVLHYHADMLPISDRYSATLSDFSLGTVDDSVFLLSHYGLPDSPLAAHPPEKNKLMQWFLIGNGILLALIVFYVMIQRFRTAQTRENLS